MVSCHEKDSTFLRSDSVKSVQESSEWNLSSSSHAGNLSSFNKNSIDIFKKNNGLSWGFIQSSVQIIVIHWVWTQVKIAYIELHCTGNSKSEGCFTSSWRTIEKISSSIWYTLLLVPCRWVLESLDISNEILGDVFIKNNWINFLLRFRLAL